MTARNRRILAREFLVGALCIAAGFVAFAGTFMFNVSKDYSSRSVLDEAAAKRRLADSLEKPYMAKMDTRSKFYDASPVTSYYADHAALWDRLLFLSASDSITHKWDHVWRDELKSWVNESGMAGPAELRRFIEENRISGQDAAGYNRSVELRDEARELFRRDTDIVSSKMTLGAQVHFSILVILIMLVLLFPVRFFAMGIVWSVKTLRHG